MFEMQKNDNKHDKVIHGWTDDPNLCPVLQWARLVNRIWTYACTTEDTPVCAVWRHGWLEQITSQQVLVMLWAACTTFGSACLGFEPRKIGTHSLCLGAVMEMYLAGVPVYTIMLISRWLSNAFLCYIWKQAKQFSKDIAKKMLMHCSSGQSQTSHLKRCQTTTPSSTTIKTTLKQGKILDATCHNRCNYRLSPSATDWSTTPSN